MNKSLTLSLSAVLFVGVATLSNAQEPTATPTEAQRAHLKEVEARQTKQKDRIEAGEKSGELSTTERHDVQKDEDRIQEKKKEYMEKNDGHITKKEQRSLNESESKIGHEIYEDKHNDSKAAPEANHSKEAKSASEEKKHKDEKSHGDEKPQQ